MKRYLILIFMIICIVALNAEVTEINETEYNWGVNVFVSLEGSADIPDGSSDLFTWGSSPYEIDSWCGYAEVGLFYAIWISDVNAGDVSSTFLPGDFSYGFQHYGSGYLAFAMDNFKNEARDAAKEYEDGDTLHIRLMYNDGETIWVYGLDQIFSSADLDEFSSINISAVMEPGPHEVWSQTYFHCFPTGIDERPTTTPTEYEIAQNSPNPFNSTTDIDYSIPEQANVTLDVFDISGRHIKGLVNENLNSGRYSVKWDGTDESGNTVPSGTYFYKIKAGDYEAERKMLLIK